jgi:subtilisin family serine protease
MRWCKLLTRIDAPVVASAGNDGQDDELAFPAVLEDTVSVGAINNSGTELTSSNWSSSLTVAAPGYLIDGLDETGAAAAFGTGTSMAAPHVAGALVLLRELYPDVPAGKLVSVLRESGTKTAGLYKSEASRLDLKDAIEQLDTLTLP